MPEYETIMTFEAKASKNGKCYTVKRRLDTGAISCDCKVWIFNQNNDRTCFHTERVKVLAFESKSPPLYLPSVVLASAVRNIPTEGPITEKPRQLRMEKEK